MWTRAVMPYLKRMVFTASIVKFRQVAREPYVKYTRSR